MTCHPERSEGSAVRQPTQKSGVGWCQRLRRPQHADKLKLQLAALDNAKSANDMNAPGWRLHPLRGNLQDHWSVQVSGNWRLTFAFEDGDAVLVGYRDYH